MTKLRVNNFSVSIDGYGAGPHQSRAEPLGIGGESLHDWMVTTRTFQQTYGSDGPVIALRREPGPMNRRPIA